MSVITQNKFRYHQDPGHGWIQVPMALIKELGIAGKITGYSYQSADNAFLEEDLDASTFIDAFKERYGTKPEFESIHTNGSSFIRSYPSFKQVDA